MSNFFKYVFLFLLVFILVSCTPEGTPTDDTDELLLQAAEEIELAGQVTQSFTLPTSLEV